MDGALKRGRNARGASYATAPDLFLIRAARNAGGLSWGAPRGERRGRDWSAWSVEFLVNFGPFVLTAAAQQRRVERNLFRVSRFLLGGSAWRALLGTPLRHPPQAPSTGQRLAALILGGSARRDARPVLWAAAHPDASPPTDGPPERQPRMPSNAHVTARHTSTRCTRANRKCRLSRVPHRPRQSNSAPTTRSSTAIPSAIYVRCRRRDHAICTHIPTAPRSPQRGRHRFTCALSYAAVSRPRNTAATSRLFRSLRRPQ